MKRLIVILCCIASMLQYTRAEETTLYETFRKEMDSLFEGINKKSIPTSILAEYGFHLVPLYNHAGVPTDSNYVNREVWEMLYAGLYDSQIYSMIGMRKPDEFYELTKDKLSIMYYKYNTIADDAEERGLVGIVDGRLQVDSNNPDVYDEKECFAVMPIDGSLPMVFDKSNFFSNTGLDVTKVEYKINNSSYRPISFTGHASRVYSIDPGARFRLDKKPQSAIYAMAELSYIEDTEIIDSSDCLRYFLKVGYEF